MELKLANYGTALATRDRARRMLVEMDFEPTSIDFEGVRSISYSFADECLGKILQKAQDENRQVCLLNLEGKPADCVEKLLLHRGLTEACLVSDLAAA